MKETKGDYTSIDALIGAFSSERLRWIIGQTIAPQEDMNEEELGIVIEKIVTEEKERYLIVTKIGGEPSTIPEISEMTGLPTKRVLYHIIALRRERIVNETGVKGDYYLYGVGG